MKTPKYILHTVLLSVLLLGALPATSMADAPLEIGGFRLGTSIEDYELTSYRNFLKEVVVQDLDGFRKGIISYGICKRPGEIVKIKLKYRDSSSEFYKKLFRRFKKKFGKPDAYIGDTFGIVKTWKWTFTDKDGNRVLLRLQHNLKDPDESMGNTVKLEYPDWIEEERICFNRECASRRGHKKKSLPSSWSEKTWQLMIPR